MRNIRKLMMTAAAVVAAGAAWHAESIAQERASSGAGVVTVFDHAKLDASFAKALTNGGTAPLWSRTSGYGTSNVSVHSRDSTKSNAARAAAGSGKYNSSQSKTTARPCCIASALRMRTPSATARSRTALSKSSDQRGSFNSTAGPSGSPDCARSL